MIDWVVFIGSWSGVAFGWWGLWFLLFRDAKPTDWLDCRNGEGGDG